MGLSLSQSSRKSRIGADPNNTQWAHDTDRFGHQQMVKMGWRPGRGLGSSVEGAREHVKVRVKTDAHGLGHSAGQADQPTGLDVFQRILGKLNGDEDSVNQTIERRERQVGLYMHFVPGGVLEGTVKTNREQRKARKSAEKQKRKAERQASKRQSELKSQRKSKADPPEPDMADSSSGSDGVAEPKPRKAQARGIQATRNRYIAMKRQATADAKSLKEILML